MSRSDLVPTHFHDTFPQAISAVIKYSYYGSAWTGEARSGTAWHSKVGRGWVWRGEVWRGQTWQGAERLGKA